MSDDKVCLEVAEQEFKRFVDMMDLDLNESEMDQEDKEDYLKHKNRIIKAIKLGKLIINDNGEPVYSLKDSDQKITFYEPTGATLLAMDKRKQSEDISKLYAAMAEMTKNHPSIFSKMKMADLKVCMGVASFFLA